MRNPCFLEKSMLPEGHKRFLRELVPPGHGHAETNPGACRPLIAFSALLFFSRKRRSCRGRDVAGAVVLLPATLAPEPVLRPTVGLPVAMDYRAGARCGLVEDPRFLVLGASTGP